MKPVAQTVFGSPDGNCLAACIASILELPTEAVPVSGRAGEWPEELTAFLEPLGYAWIWIDYRKLPAHGEDGEWPFYWTDSLYWIASGPSGRGLNHSVVCKGREMAWNPAPGDHDTEIESIDDAIILLRQPVDPKLTPAEIDARVRMLAYQRRQLRIEASPR
jgi:hypothetical protein